jgi:FkbM family methyltransferase
MNNLLRNIVKELPFARTVWQKLRRKTKWELIDLRDQSHIKQILQQLIQPSTNAVDIGANRGEFMENFLNLAPSGIHYAFEPVPDLAENLKAKFPRVTVINAALSDAAGETEFHLVENNPALSGIAERTDLPSTDIIRKIRVKMLRLDDVIPQSHQIDFIKIDVEGAELNVFRGARATIKRTQPYILFEHGLGPASCYEANSERVYDELASLNMQIYRLDSFVDGGSPLGRIEFCELVNSKEYWNWIAGPKKPLAH